MAVNEIVTEAELREKIRIIEEENKKLENEKLTIAELAREVLQKNCNKDVEIESLKRDIEKYVEEISQKSLVHFFKIKRRFLNLKLTLQNRNNDLVSAEQRNLQFQQELEIKNNIIAELRKQALMPSPDISRNDEENLELISASNKMVEMEREYKILADEFEKANVRICELQWCLEKEVSQKKELDQLYRGTQNEIQFVDERLKLEKDLVLLKTQNDRLRAQLEENKQENEELRQEIYLLRNHRNGIDEENIVDTHSEISKLRMEIAVLTEKLANQTSTAELKIPPEKENPVLYSRIYNYTNACLTEARKEVKALTRKLEQAIKERNEYFDKFEYSNIQHLREASRNRELECELELLKKKIELGENRCNRQIIGAKEICEKVNALNEHGSICPSLTFNSSVQSISQNDSTLVHETVTHCDYDAKNEDNSKCTNENSDRVESQSNLKRIITVNENGIIPLQKCFKFTKKQKEASAKNPVLVSGNSTRKTRLALRKKRIPRMEEFE
ncbi:unnamed protein product [Dracunculus medinensis]|uniref:HMMR_C domain-containing protein n=1 Tax=Dracunculus medinensis TaxID=318479 RepID=A0A158Q4J1_DRAME|nr:unnamed protein product [Dracunculus medinensis]